MTKKELVAKISETYGTTKVAATEMYEAVFDTLVDALAEGNEVAIPNLGKFVIKERAERTARNPQTGEELTVPAHKVVAFKASKTLKDAVAEL